MTEEADDIINSIEDICLDLTDDGFYILIDLDKKGHHHFGGNMFIKISRERKWSYSESSDVVKRLQSFLGDKFVRVLIDDGTNDSWMSVDDYVEKYFSDDVKKIFSMIIVFKIEIPSISF